MAALLLALLSGCGDSGRRIPAGPGTDQPDDGQPATTAFADTALEQAVRQALAQPTGDLSQTSLHSLTTLSAANRGIVDLHGIEQLDSLTALDLSNNRITDLSPLDSLTHLQMLDLSWNQVSDLGPLAGVVTLETLALEGNQVTDLGPLLGLPALASLDLTGNPLTEDARITQLAALMDRGIQVSFEVPGAEGDTPSGSIAFASDRGGTLDIYVVDVDGTHLVNLTRGSAGNNWEPVWSPDWTRIAFSSDREGGFAPHPYVMDADGSNLTRLIEEPGWNPQWSPQGDRLAYVRSEGGGIVVLDLASGSVLSLTAGMGGQEYLPCWSPDGTRIAFSSNGEGTWQVYVVPADGGAAQRVTQEAGSAVALAWSPDGSGILCARGPYNRPSIFSSGLTDRVIRHELYLSQPELWVVELAGGRSRRRLEEAQQACGATWSPDGRYLVYTSRQGGDFEIYLSLPGIGVSVNLTSRVGADLTPSWSPRSVAEYAAGLPTEEGPEPALDPEEEVPFADSALEAAVREQVGLPTGPIRRRDVEILDQAYLHRMGISDLRGIEFLARMVTLDLDGNQIRDLSPLSGLSGLRQLSLSSNQIVDLTPLARLRGLMWLSLSGNQIEDVTPLAGLVCLSDLQLGRNPIRDISPLAALRPKWTLSLSLSRTQVSDLRPLLQIPGPNDQTPALTELKVVGCPLDDYSRNTVIPALRERGTTVVE
jgi:Tol biopolymer transport system component/Leucine-rich repeat (LRR) protein